MFFSVMLSPPELNNEIYLNIKRKLKKEHENRCFGNYGLITEIYKVDEYKKGKMSPENMSASVLFDVSFSCRLCVPLKNQKIICKVDRINRMLLRLKNGPIFVIVTNERINQKIFFIDDKNNIIYKKDDQNIILKPNDYVKVTIERSTFHNGDTHIMALGILDSVATEKEIKEHFESMYETDSKEEDLEKYLKENT